ncbi:hypothetical protein FCM35_KLT17636 [Carex littledalei]|uniref:Uncharacterized protein n=1 Tax=Carex littledalei TaxID=544730 RepID=A0A833VY01_9POAL|nr:hypothetical protein FCM35_KLT17636 [Carex littledalei]
MEAVIDLEMPSMPIEAELIPYALQVWQKARSLSFYVQCIALEAKSRKGFVIQAVSIELVASAAKGPGVVAVLRNSHLHMNELKTSSDFSTGSFADSRDTASWASQDFDQPKDIPSFGMFSDATCPPDIPKAPKKIKKKKKTRPPTSPGSTTSARSSRSSKSRTSFATAFEDFDQERKD